MDNEIEAKINILGTKIDAIESINNALMASLFGMECLTQNDAYNFAYLLEGKIKDLKIRHNKLIEDLKI